MGLYSELLYAIIPTLFLCFLPICYPYILLHFNVFYSLFNSIKSVEREILMTPRLIGPIVHKLLGYMVTISAYSYTDTRQYRTYSNKTQAN